MDEFVDEVAGMMTAVMMLMALVVFGAAVPVVAIVTAVAAGIAASWCG